MTHVRTSLGAAESNLASLMLHNVSQDLAFSFSVWRSLRANIRHEPLQAQERGGVRLGPWFETSMDW